MHEPARRMITLGAALTGLLFGGSAAPSAAQGPAQAQPSIAPDGAAHVPAMVVPFSPFASEEAKQTLFATQARQKSGMGREAYQKASGAAGGSADIGVINGLRQDYEAENAAHVKRALSIYPDVVIQKQTIAGLNTVSVTPKGGVSAKNADRVLIELHGGAFTLASARPR